jgi:NAD(P)-dependent dehydrogenase (short-subunit alcohol dehydrogenase family)
MNDRSGMLAGKAIVVTGSGRGIGAACAKGIARQGASVVVNDVNAAVAEETAAEIEAAGGTAIVHIADVSDWDAAGGLIEACISRFGKIDGLVNNAALFHVAPITALDPKIARGMVDVNVLGPLHCLAHVVKPMLAQGSGAIVNIGSGAHLGMRGLGLYGLTKGAVASMVYTWALELEGSGVRINGIFPIGATNLAMNTQEYLTNRFGLSFEQESASKGRTAPLIQAPEANSPVVEYLLSDEAADVNGQLVRVAKGQLQFYTHPVLLMPNTPCEDWTSRGIAERFAAELKQRQQPCGPNWGTSNSPEEVDLSAGAWKQHQSAQA